MAFAARTLLHWDRGSRYSGHKLAGKITELEFSKIVKKKNCVQESHNHRT